MSTTEVTPNVDSNTSDLAIKTENETYRVYVKLKDGKIDAVKYGTAGKNNSYWDEMEKNPDYQLAAEQTVKKYAAGTIEGAQQIVNDPEEFVNIFNRGLMAKFQNKIGAYFNEVDESGTNLKFDPSTEPLDSLDMLNEPTQRRNLSPIDKAFKGLQAAFPNLTKEQLAAMIAQLQGA